MNRKRKTYIASMRGLMIVSTIITVALALFILIYVFAKGIPNINWELLSTKPSYSADRIGILPDILNTIYILLATLLIVIPLGVGAAIYLTEYAKNKKIVAIIEYAAETLSGIPSIIYGLVGMLLFSNNFGTSLIAGSLTLVIMNLPTIMRTTQESLKTVPQSYREGAFGLGAGKWRVIRTVVLPGCVDGVITGCILSAGRIIGESAALLFTAGFAHAIHGVLSGLASPGATLTVALYVYAKEEGEFGIAFAIAAYDLNVAYKLISKFSRKTFRQKEKSMSDVITVKDLCLWYGENQALKNININIPEKSITAFIGPSGCGKSTFLKTLNRMNDLVGNVKITGEVCYEGKNIYDKDVDVNELRKDVGMVFQRPNPFPMSIYDNIAYGPRTHGITNRVKLDEIVEKALRDAAIWDEVKDRLKKSALGLSGGQQQRLCIARALAVGPKVLLMDEPTSALDPISTSRIEELTLQLKKDYTIIMVTHNMQQAVRISDYTAFFLLGDLIEFDSTEKLFSQPSEKKTEDYITGRFG